MVFVFVSRDPDEFDKYFRGCGKTTKLRDVACCLSPEEANINVTATANGDAMTSLSAYVGVVPSTDPGAIHAEALGSREEAVDTINVKYIVPDKTIMGCLKDAENPFAVVIKSESEMNRLKMASAKERYGGVSTRHIIDIIKETLHAALKLQLNEEFRLEDQEVHLLVHWGGVTDFVKEEDEFNKIISSNGYNKVVKCKELLFHEVSSRRPDCFNVNGYEVNIPYTQDEAKELIQRFEEAQGHDKILNLIMRIASEDSVDCSADEFKQVSKFLSDDTRRRKLRFFALESPMRWIADWKPWKEFVGVNGDAENAISQMFSPIMPADRQTRYKPHVKLRALFIQLVKEGIVK